MSPDEISQLRRDVAIQCKYVLGHQSPSYKSRLYWTRAFADTMRDYCHRTGQPSHDALIVLHLGATPQHDRRILESCYAHNGFSRKMRVLLTNQGLAGLIEHNIQLPLMGLADLRVQHKLSQRQLNRITNQPTTKEL